MGKNYFENFFEAIFNIFIFLPFFFSVKTLLKTLFDPWKNIVTVKRERGFSFSELFNRFSFNVISRFMGLWIRGSVLIFYLIVQVAFVISLPIIAIIYFLMLPLVILVSKFSPTEEQEKEIFKKNFISSHTLNQENLNSVEKWFEDYYVKKNFESKWWKLSNLMQMPPLGRDWSMGYTPALDQYSLELTSSSYQSKIKHIVDREKEINQIERALSKSNEANVIITGDEGVGKHTIVDAFAKKVYEGNTNNLLMYKRVLKLNMEKILTADTDQKKREEFLEQLLDEAEKAKNIIIMIDRFDKYISSEENQVNLSIPIEKYAKGSSVQIIAVTTPYLFQKKVYPNEKISRIFTKVDVFEVGKQEALEILLAKTDVFEQRYNLAIPYETIIYIIDKSSFYITDIPFPEKAMQLLDEACIYCTQTLKKNIVTPEMIDKILTEKTHIKTYFSDDIREKLLQMEQLLSQQIIGQQTATMELASSLRKSFIMKEKRKKPLASLLFLGPTGVGKTETAKAIAKIFFGSDKELVRFDMSNYQSKSDIPQLIGSQNSNIPGLLSSALREKPYGVLLLDEIEKADKDLINIFLTIMDEGYFTDGFGKRIDCKNMVVIATSNAGSDFIFKNSQASAPTSQKEIIDFVVGKNIFAPEFLNRFDSVVAFNPLDPATVLLIAKKMINSLAEQIFSLYKIKLVISDGTIKNIIDKNYDPSFGARNIEHALKNGIEDKIAKLLLEKQVKEGEVIEV